MKKGNKKNHGNSRFFIMVSQNLELPTQSYTTFDYYAKNLKYFSKWSVLAEKSRIGGSSHPKISRLRKAVQLKQFCN